MKIIASSLLALFAGMALHAQTAAAATIDSVKPVHAARAERQIQVADLIDAIIKSGTCDCRPTIGVPILNSYRAIGTKGGF